MCDSIVINGGNVSIQISGPCAPADGSVTAAKINSGNAGDGQVLTADGAGGAAWETAAGGGPGYLKYVALLTQNGTAAPVATVLENTLGGTVVWTREVAGMYRGTLAGAFPEHKVAVITTDNMAAVGDGPTAIKAGSQEGGNNYVFLQTFDAWVNADGLVVYTPIEVRVYP